MILRKLKTKQMEEVAMVLLEVFADSTGNINRDFGILQE